MISIDGNNNVVVKHIYGSSVTVNYNDVEKIKLEIDRLGQEILTATNEQIKSEIQDALEVLSKVYNREIFPDRLTVIPNITSEDVIGRETELREIDELLTANDKVVLLSGIGGIGKTTLAKYFLALFKDKYQHIAWIGIDELSNVKEAFALKTDLIDSLYINNEINSIKKNNNFVDEAFSLVINRMRLLKGNIKKPYSLLIIDNAGEDIENLKVLDHISLKPNWKVLVTSRYKLEGFAKYELGFLTLENAVNLFYLHYNKETDDELVKEIIAIVDYHTLAIELISRVSQDLRLPLDEVVKVLKKKGLHISENSAVKVKHSNNEKIKNINDYLLAIFDISKISRDELWNMIQFSVLPSIPIRYADNDDENIISLLDIKRRKKDQFTSGINSLVNKGWLTWDSQNDTFTMHALIQDVLRQKLNPDSEKCSNLIKSLLQKMHAAPEENPLKTIRFTKYAKSVFSNIPHPHENLSKLGNSLAIRMTDIGDYKQALNIQNRVVKMREQIFEPNNILLAHSYNALAMCIARAEGDIDKAIRFTKKALRILEKDHPNEYEYLADAYNSMALRLWHKGDFKNAVKYLKKTIETDKKKYQSDAHIYIANSLNALGRLYTEMGDFKNALVFFNKSKDMFDALRVGENHPLLAALYDNMGLAFIHDNDLEKAQFYIEKSLEIKKAIYADAPDHDEFANSYNQMALILRRREKYGEALVFQQKAHTIFFNKMTNKHRSLGISYYNLSEIYLGLKEFDLCRKNLDLAADIFKTNYPDSERLINMVGNLNNRLMSALLSNSKEQTPD